MAKKINTELRDNITEYIRARLTEMQDEAVREKRIASNPAIASDKIIGAPTPALKRFAKSISEQAYLDFDTMMAVRAYLTTLPHRYLDEDVLHMLLLVHTRDFNKCMLYMDLFLPYVSSLEVVQQPLPTIFKDNQWILFPSARRWSWAEQPYACYYGIRLLRELYMQRWFYDRELDSVSRTVSTYDFVNDMAAAYMTDALIYHWDLAIKVIEDRRLTPEIHARTLQKVSRSRKLTAEQRKQVTSLKYDYYRPFPHWYQIDPVLPYKDWWWSATAE